MWSCPAEMLWAVIPGGLLYQYMSVILDLQYSLRMAWSISGAAVSEECSVAIVVRRTDCAAVVMDGCKCIRPQSHSNSDIAVERSQRSVDIVYCGGGTDHRPAKCAGASLAFPVPRRTCL